MLLISLNVGCGSFPSGDVNVDLVRDFFVDVVCDAHFLPFRDSVFGRVVCDNVLEHCKNPLKVVWEMYRVGGILEIYVPTRWCDLFSPKVGHLWVLGESFFVGGWRMVKCRYVRYWLVFPMEMRVDIVCGHNWLWREREFLN